MKRTENRTVMENIEKMKPDELAEGCSQENVRKMDSVAFEVFCKDVLVGFFEESGVKDFYVKHNVKKKAHDGNYQIDIFATFNVDNIEITLLCECKQHKNPIKREVVASLHQKLQSLGAQKGVLMATSTFQSGAIEYAKQHHIALIKMYDYNYEYIAHSGERITMDSQDPFVIAEKMMPPIRACYYLPEQNNPVLIYPTSRQLTDIGLKQQKLLDEYGLS